MKKVSGCYIKLSPTFVVLPSLRQTNKLGNSPHVRKKSLFIICSQLKFYLAGNSKTKQEEA